MDSIWVCTKSSDEFQNTLTRYSIRPEQFLCLFVDFLLLDDKGKPFIVLEHERKVPVVIERATAEDLKATAKTPKWQTDWTSEYLADEKN